MTIKSWVEEFYPVPAKVAGKMDDIEATKHCLKKWKGATKDNLLIHAVIANECAIYNSDDCDDDNSPKIRAHLIDVFSFESKTCALCAKYDMDGLTDCESCPIFKCNGRSCHGEYNYFYVKNDPNPMISLLEKTLEFLENENERKADL